MKHRSMLALVAFALLIAPPVRTDMSAQVSGLISKDHLFDDGTTWQTSTTGQANAGVVCVWVGREPDGAYVFGWENQPQCTGRVQQWGYDLNSDMQVDVVMYVRQPQNCSGLVIDTWQWFYNNSWSEAVTGQCLWFANAQQWQFVYNNWRSAAGGTCPAQAALVKQRQDNAYNNYLALMRAGNVNRLQVKQAWHAYNQASLAFQACRNMS